MIFAATSNIGLIRKENQDALGHSKKNGYAEGITHILMKSLGDLKPTERPIHCSDKKRLKFYVKEDNKWEQDSNNQKIDKTLKDIKQHQCVKISDWEELHPNYMDDPKLLTEWQTMLSHMVGFGNDYNKELNQHNKIKRNLGLMVDITDELKNK